MDSKDDKIAQGKTFTLHVKGDHFEKDVCVDMNKLPFQDKGLPGSVLDICLGHSIELDHACGGVLACSTCHVYLTKGQDDCNEASTEELDMLDHAPDVKPISRLACQLVASGNANIEIVIPSWNRNRVRESHS